MNLIESIYNEPEKWRLTSHYMLHEGGARLWTANGLLFCQPEGGSFGILDKIRAFVAFRWWCKNAPVEALDNVK